MGFTGNLPATSCTLQIISRPQDDIHAVPIVIILYCLGMRTKKSIHGWYRYNFFKSLYMVSTDTIFLKDKQQAGRKYLQKAYLIKDSYSSKL